MNKNTLIAYILVLTFAGLFGYNYYTGTPNYLFEQDYKAGVAAIENNEHKLGIELLTKAMYSHTNISPEATKSLRGLLELEFLEKFTPKEVAVIFQEMLPVKSVRRDFRDILVSYLGQYETDHPFQAGQLSIVAVQSALDDKARLKFQEKAYQLLEPFEQEVQSDKKLAMAVTLLDELFNECKGCPTILQQYEKGLSSSEAARALGQYYARVNEIEKAFTLLKPYTDAKLKDYRKAERAYNTELDRVWQATIKFLDAGKAPDYFYKKYNEADDARQSELVNEIYVSNVEKSEVVKSRLANYQKSAAIVPVVLDLGIVRLGRATSMDDGALRKVELAAAEAMFLAVKSYAGETDDYQLYLGQVYYWLGKEGEGDKLFNALINKYGRGHSVLASISSVMRDLGAKVKATAYIEEAYEKADEKTNKQQYAYQRYFLSRSVEEQIHWLEKSDSAQFNIQADLHSAKATLAEEDGNNKLANSYYQKAIDAYLKMPEGLKSFNNIALIYMSKFDLGRDENDYDQALENMDKAVQLSPEDSIVLYNAASSNAVRAYRDILSDKFDFSAIDYRPSLDLFAYLYNDEKGKSEYARKIINSDSYAKMSEYTKRSVLLAPKDSQFFLNAFSLYKFLSMDDELISLSNRLDDIDLEVEDSTESQISYRSGKNDAESISSINGTIDAFIKRYSSLTIAEHPFEYVVVDSAVSRNRLSLLEYDEPVDLNKLLKKTERNYRSYPSSGTRSIFTKVLTRVIIEKSKKENDQFKAFYNTYGRIMDDDLLLAIAASTIPDYRSEVIKWEATKKLFENIVHSETMFSSLPSSSNWYLLESFEHQQANKSKVSYSEYDLAPYVSRIYDSVVTNKEELAIMKFIEHRIRGEEDLARKVIEQGLEAGLILPEALIRS